MSEFVAGAFVDVKPDTKGFRDALKTKVNASIKSAGVFKVPIQFDIKSFKRQLSAEARAAKIRIPVEVGGNVAELRAQINAKIQKATAGMKIRVPIELVDTGVGSRAGARARSDSGAATDRAAGAQKKLTEAQKLSASIEKTLIGLDTRAAATKQMLTDAAQQNLTVEERGLRLRSARKAADAAVRESTDALARSQNAVTNGQREALAIAQRDALATRAAVLAKETEAKVASAEAAAISKVVIAREQTDAAMAVEITKITNLNELHVVENELLAAEASLKRATNRARELDLTSLAKENQLRLEQIALQKEAIITQRTQLQRQSKGATQKVAGARGAGATLLSLLGVRGATLAAGGEFLAGAAAVAITAKAIKSAADLEKQLNILRVTSRATASEMQEVRVAAVELGRDVRLPGVSASDAAKAMLQLVRAGLSIQDAIDGAKGTLQLATAAEVDFAEAGNLVASAINAFALAGVDATHVADLFTNAANESQGEITDVGIALQQAAGAASLVGVSLDDTIALLTLLARAGLKGSDAGTSLRAAFTKLIAPTKKAAQILKELNVNVRDSQGNIRPEVFADFARAQENLTRVEQQRNIAIVFGADALRAQALIGRQGISGLNEVRGALEREGAAQELAGAQAEGLTGKVSALSSNLETLGTTLGSFTVPPLKLFVDVLNDGVSSVNDLLGVIPKITAKAKDLGDEADKSVPGWRHVADAILDAAKASERLAGEKVKQGVDPTRVPRQLIGQGLALTGFDGFISQNKQAQEETEKTRNEIEKLFRFLGQGPLTDTALNETLVALDAMADKLSKGDANAQAMARTIRKLIADIQRTGNVPNTIDLKVLLDPSQARSEAVRGANTMLDVIKLFGPDFLRTWDDLFNLQPAIDKAIEQLDAAPFVESLDAKLALAQAHGSDAQQIAILQQQRANAAIREQQARVNPNLTDAQRNKQITQAANDFKKADDAIQQIIDSAAQDVKSRADKIKTAQDKLDQSALDAITGKEQGLLNEVAVAKTTKSLADDLKTARRLRAFYLKQIEIVAQTVKDKDTRNKAIKDLKQKLFDLDLDIAGTIADKAEQIFDDAAQAAEETVTLADDLRVANRRVRFWENQVKIRKDLVRKRKATAAELQVAQDSLDAAEKEAKKALQDRRQQQRENRQERLDLKIQIAQDNENVRAEIVAREAQIRNTKALIRQTRRGSLQRLRLIAQLRQEQKELRDLKKEKEKSAKEAQAVIFAFLQAQQGFAANLLSNLVPFHVADNALGSAGAGVPGTGGGGARGGGGGGGGGGVIGTLSDLGGVDPQTGRPIRESGQVAFPITPGEAIAREATVAAASKPQQGFTNTQVSRLLALQAQVVSLLGGRVSKDSHPHAKTQAKRSGGSADVE